MTEVEVSVNFQNVLFTYVMSFIQCLFLNPLNMLIKLISIRLRNILLIFIIISYLHQDQVLGLYQFTVVIDMFEQVYKLQSTFPQLIRTLKGVKDRKRNNY